MRRYDDSDALLRRLRWVVLFVGVALSAACSSDAREKLVRYRWPAAPCKLEKAEAHPTFGGGQAGNELVVVASYEVDTERYEVESIDRPQLVGAATGPADHRVPKPFVCRVNPENPRQFSFVVGPPIGAILFSLFPLFVAGLVFFMMSRRDRRPRGEGPSA